MTSGLILAYVEREAGREAVDEMLARAGLTDREQELRDENSWFSFDAKIMLWEAAEAVTGDKRVAERVGESALDFGVALSLKRALRALGSPDFVYRNVARANSKFNWAHRLSIVDNADDHVRLEYRDVSGVGYQHYDCDYTYGLLRTVPQLFGLPAARVAQPLCGARGDDHCEFDVQWVGGLQRIKRASVLACACAASVAGAGAFLDPLLLAVGAGLGAVAAVVAVRSVTLFMRRRIESLETQVRDQDLTAAAQLASLTALSSELRLDEVLDQITASASSAIAGTQFALLVAGNEGLQADRYSNIPARSLRHLERWAQTNERTLRDGSIVIDDLAAVPSLSALAVDGQLPLGSACVVPLVFRGRLHGALVALAPGATVFLPHDVRALETYAGHAAIALSNASLVEQLEREAAEDPLTGLANKRVFRLRCAAEMDAAARTHDSVALVVLDVDHFKQVNDTYGHAFGDQILLAVADALGSVVRGHDTAARIGGEEFALLLPGATLDKGREVAERAREAIAAIALPDGDKLACSAGVAATRGEDAPDSELFDHADRALYEAKRQGRARTAVANCLRARSHATGGGVPSALAASDGSQSHVTQA
ncbi:MAG: diguanylate cyclase domain-containing protein [Solirubrobacteraceae bacterium]